MEPSDPKSATGSGSEPRSVSTTSAVWHPTHIAEQRQKLVLNAFEGFLANDRWLPHFQNPEFFGRIHAQVHFGRAYARMA